MSGLAFATNAFNFFQSTLLFGTYVIHIAAEFMKMDVLKLGSKNFYSYDGALIKFGHSYHQYDETIIIFRTSGLVNKFKVFFLE